MMKEFRRSYQVDESWADETALDRRSLTLGAALLISVAAAPIAEADDASTEAADSQTHLAEVQLASGATLTIERRGPVALFGINRPHIQNRIDPETFLCKSPIRSLRGRDSKRVSKLEPEAV